MYVDVLNKVKLCVNLIGPSLNHSVPLIYFIDSLMPAFSDVSKFVMMIRKHGCCYHLQTAVIVLSVASVCISVCLSVSMYVIR